MSKRYGLTCKTCQAKNKPAVLDLDNMCRHNAEHILGDIKELAKIAKLLDKMWGDYEFAAEYQDRFNTRHILEFAVTHGKHKVIVTDQYGNEFPDPPTQ